MKTRIQQLILCLPHLSENVFCTFAPGVVMLFFRVRDNSILPPRLPICVGSDGVEEEMGSVNCGCGSQIIFGFQLGESFGSVS